VTISEHGSANDPERPTALRCRWSEVVRKASVELNEVLRGFGHPIVVAGRYLPIQYLVGPDVFPLYWYVLQAVLIVITIVGGLLMGIALLTATNAVQAALQVAVNFWWFALQAAALVTKSGARPRHGAVQHARRAVRDRRDQRHARSDGRRALGPALTTAMNGGSAANAGAICGREPQATTC
jgi:hypothetical protein